MATQAQIKLTISKLSTSAIEKNIEAGKYNEEELKVANEIVAGRNANKGKAEAEKAKGKGGKKAAKPAKVETKDDSTETAVEIINEAPTAKKPAKPAKEKKVKEPKAKKEPKPRKEGHGDIRATIKEFLVQFVAPAQVRSLVKEKLGLAREVHYSEVKSVLDRLKADKEAGEAFTAQWEEKFKKEPAAPKEATTPKEKGKKKVTIEEVVAEPTAEELAQLAETEAENAEETTDEAPVSEAA